MQFRIANVLALSIVTCLTSVHAQAGTVEAFLGVSGDGLASMSFNNIFPVDGPNNDDVVGPTNNLIHVHQKAYDRIGVIDMEFAVANSGGVTEYLFREGVDNSTGIPWTDYHLQLGFGTGADFVPSPAGDGLDFDAPDYNSTLNMAPFTTIVVGEDDIDAYDGVFPHLSFTNFEFTIDVPDGIERFTVRQYPTIAEVPEPASLVFAGLVTCVGLLAYRYK